MTKTSSQKSDSKDSGAKCATKPVSNARIRDIPGQMTILSTYDDRIRMSVKDKISGVTFLDMEFTREQFINATTNRLGNTEVEKTTVRYLDLVGKRMEMKSFSFEIANYHSEEEAREKVATVCPAGWEPDMGFGSRTSFFSKGDKNFAITTIRRWVGENDNDTGIAQGAE